MSGEEEDVILPHLCCHLQKIVLSSSCLHKASALYKFPSFTPTVPWGEILVQVEKELLNLHTGRLLTENNITDYVLIQFDLLMVNTELLETCRGL
jgi:hypothetical protein